MGRAEVAGKVEAEADRRRARMAYGMCPAHDGCSSGLACDECLRRPEVVSSVAGRMDVVRCGEGMMLVFCPAARAAACLPGISS